MRQGWGGVGISAGLREKKAGLISELPVSFHRLTVW